MYWNGHMSTGGWILSVLWTLIIIALVGGGVVWLVTALGSRDKGAAPPEASGESAREILDRRLAGGELTVEQYQQLREALGDPPSTERDTGPARPASAPG